MPRNVEIKARLSEPAKAHAIAARLSGTQAERIAQRDVFFPTERGRLKLRIFEDGQAELIQYDRPNTAGIGLSDYRIARTPDARVLLEILTRALGVAGEVRKIRSLYLIGQTRVHIDCVEGLGDFLEFEVVLRPGQSEAEGSLIADDLLKQFEIDRSALIGQAYVDLLLAQARTTPAQRAHEG